MKLHLSLIFIIFCSLSCLAQKPDEKSIVAAQRTLLKKQILVDDLDNQAKNVPFAAVRIFVRTKLAAWLWKNGVDETGRAEQIAVRAVDELYEKKDEIPDPDFLSQDLFPLLELNAKETAKKLRAKYDVDSGEDLSNAASLLDKEGGAKILAGKIRKYLADGKDLSAISFLMGQLQDKKSPEFLSILIDLVNLEESGRNSFTLNSLFWAVDFFRDASVPNELKIRFYQIALNKARNALQLSESSELRSADQLIFAILPDINANALELSAEASAIKSALSARTSQKSKELQERDKRIEESSDKLSAYISEAEKSANSSDKYNLLILAILLATKEEKFQLAADLMDKTIENISDKDFPKPDFRKDYHDQRLVQIVQTALYKNDVDSARYATKKIIKELSKAEALRRLSLYYYEKKDIASALAAYDEALKLAEKADNGDKSKFYVLFRLIPAAQKIDKSRISEVASITAGAINRIPTLNPEDKPET
ncbi:MAG: hypothetical protein ABI686_08220, partial [Acidobacteriota bacterium]